MAAQAEAGGTRSIVPGMGVADQVAFLNTILHSSTEYSIVAKDLDGLMRPPGGGGGAPEASCRA